MKNVHLLLILAILLTACAGGAAPTSTVETASEAETSSDLIIAEGKLLPASALELAFEQPGIVVEVIAQPGQTLAAGDLIASLDGTKAVQAEIAAAQLEQTSAQQALDILQRNRPLTIIQTDITLLEAQKVYEEEANSWNLGDAEEASDLELAIDDYIQVEQDYRQAQDKLKSLLAKEETHRERRAAQEDFDQEKQSLAETYVDLLASMTENTQKLDERQTRILLAITTLEIAREQLSHLEGGLDPDQIAIAESRLEAATAHLVAAKASLGHFELRAPFAGTLLSMDLSLGEYVVPGVTVAFFADTSHWEVITTDLAEIDTPNISLGDPATIQLDAFPEEEFSGEVACIDPVGHNYQGDNVYTITIALKTTDDRYLWNMTATVKIMIAAETSVLSPTK